MRPSRAAASRSSSVRMPSSRVEQRDGLRPDPLQAQQVEHRRRELREQVLVEVHGPCRRARGSGGEVPADAGHLEQARLVELGNADGGIRDRVGRGPVRADLERVLALDRAGRRPRRTGARARGCPRGNYTGEPSRPTDGGDDGATSLSQGPADGSAATRRLCATVPVRGCSPDRTPDRRTWTRVHRTELSSPGPSCPPSRRTVRYNVPDIHVTPCVATPGRPAAHGRIPGTTIPVELRALAREFSVGGVVLFRRNVEDPEQVAEVARQIGELTTDGAPGWQSTRRAAASRASSPRSPSGRRC